MKYFPKMQRITVVMLLILMGLSVPALAKDQTPATPPRILSLAPIALTPELTGKYSEQTVLVKIKATILDTGTMDSNVEVITSSGDPAFDQAVIDSLQKSVFTPAYTEDRQAISSSIVLPLNVKVEKYVPVEPPARQPDQENASVQTSP
ncbi:energy transducer TonB|uniref:TonB protein C-terminal n=1 Tax=Dendrosporobacter quercicolus TaxID=146817 RepID=A0A1G9TZP9_9FIRM|nr:energy transducer TonB [Dendrosporobacter quercicolus]NSL48805.1 energy transducer TonB [Dendrosporobacter quercicolus DSM 1736]SDM53023.1 TonB protein C-terminal [Dendrosporobacter quercicolus]